MRQAVIVAAMLAVFAAAPLFGQAQSTTVSISVLPAQALAGSTVHALAPSTIQSGQLTVKSNIPWALQVLVSGPGGAAWRPAGSPAWLVLPSRGTVRAGTRGVYVLAYEIRSSGAVTVQFSLVAQP